MQNQLARSISVASLSLLAALLIAVSPVHGDVVNSVDWGNNTYYPGTAAPDGLPTDASTSPSWITGATGGSPLSSLGTDYLRIDTATNSTNWDTRLGYRQQNNVEGINVTVEWEFRVVGLDDSGGSDASWALQHLFWIGASGSGGGNFFQIAIDETDVLITDVSGGAVFDSGNDFTQWSTVRLTIEEDPNNANNRLLNLYINNDPAPVLSTSETVDAASTDVLTKFRIGESATSNYAGGIIDYRAVRWTPNGAFPAEIPEPASMMLLVGAAGAWGLRRRR